MVKTKKQAEAIQRRRVAAGNRGHSRAVRRFLKGITGDWYGYTEAKLNLPHLAIIDEVAPEEVDGNVA